MVSSGFRPEGCPSNRGAPVVTYIHSGGHLLPDDVPPVIVKFFKEYAQP